MALEDETIARQLQERALGGKGGMSMGGAEEMGCLSVLGEGLCLFSLPSFWEATWVAVGLLGLIIQGSSLGSV